MAELRRFGEPRGIALPASLSPPRTGAAGESPGALGSFGSGPSADSGALAFDARVGSSTDPKEVLRRIKLRGRLGQLRGAVTQSRADDRAGSLVEFHQASELVAYLERNFARLKLVSLERFEKEVADLLSTISPTFELFSSYDATLVAFRLANAQLAQLNVDAGNLESRVVLARDLEAERRTHVLTRKTLQERSGGVDRLSSRLSTVEQDASLGRQRIDELEHDRDRDRRLLEKRAIQLAETRGDSPSKHSGGKSPSGTAHSSACSTYDVTGEEARSSLIASAMTWRFSSS